MPFYSPYTSGPRVYYCIYLERKNHPESVLSIDDELN
nr:MAG TPA: hypothetical protein [Bacteriophage sp.]